MGIEARDLASGTGRGPARRSRWVAMLLITVLAATACGGDGTEDGADDVQAGVAAEADGDAGDGDAGEETGEETGEEATSDETAGDDGAKAAWTAPALPEDFDPITIQISNPAGPDIWGAASDETFKEKVEEYSDGTITAEIHYGGSLVGIQEMIDSLADGVLFYGKMLPSYAPAPFPIDTWSGELAFLPVPRPVVGQLQGYAAQLDWSLNAPERVEEYRSLGVEPLLPDVQIHPNYHLLCNQPVRSLDEARGKTTRVAGPAWVPEIESVGMQPTFLSPLEQYEAMQRGVIDCVAAPLRDMGDLDIIAVGSDLTVDTEANFLGFRFGYGVNQAWWESLPVEARQIIWVAVLDAVHAEVAAAMAADFAAVREARELGVNLHTMEPDMREELQEHQAGTRERLVGNPPETVSDPEATISALEDSMERWLDVVENELGYAELPEDWEPFFNGDITMDDIDLTPWVEKLWQEIWLPRMPQ